MSDSYAPSRPTTEGRVYNLTGGDWESVLGSDPITEQRIVLNMGPQHPSTHGVLRLIVELEGESVTDMRTVIGYLHTGIEKNTEYRTWTQAVTFLTRADYLARKLDLHVREYSKSRARVREAHRGCGRRARSPAARGRTPHARGGI